MTTYRKKPVEVEAMLYDGTPATCLAVHDWLGIEHGADLSQCDRGIGIDTLEGLMHVSVGDYVIRGVAGEFYPCKPDIFAETYERVQEANDATEYRSPWGEQSFAVGDRVKTWWRGGPHGKVTRIFQERKGTRWQIEVEGFDRGDRTLHACDFWKVTS